MKILDMNQTTSDGALSQNVFSNWYYSMRWAEVEPARKFLLCQHAPGDSR